MWLAVQDRLQTGVELRKRGWKGNARCNLCGRLETGDHIFFDCITARFTWACFKEALGWDRSPISLQDFFLIQMDLGIEFWLFKCAENVILAIIKLVYYLNAQKI